MMAIATALSDAISPVFIPDLPFHWRVLSFVQYTAKAMRFDR
jgi:hypothetical protein